MIEAGSMDEKEANRRIGIMKEIRDDYLEIENKKERLL